MGLELFCTLFQLQKTTEYKFQVCFLPLLPCVLHSWNLLFYQDHRKSCKNIYYVLKLKYWKFYWIIIVLLHGNNLCFCCYKSPKDFSFRVAVCTAPEGCDRVCYVTTIKREESLPPRISGLMLTADTWLWKFRYTSKCSHYWDVTSVPLFIIAFILTLCGT
jgi:hypothetical protein